MRPAEEEWSKKLQAEVVSAATWESPIERESSTAFAMVALIQPHS